MIENTMSIMFQTEKRSTQSLKNEADQLIVKIKDSSQLTFERTQNHFNKKQTKILSSDIDKAIKDNLSPKKINGVLRQFDKI